MAVATGPARLRRDQAPLRAPAARRPPLRVVARERRPPRPARRSGVGLALAVVLLTLLAVAGAQAYLVQGQVHLARLQQELGNAQGRQRDLEAQVARLEDPAAVVGQAQQQGLRVPQQVTDLPLVTPSSTVPAAGAHAGPGTSVTTGSAASGSRR
jgi:cell division protein FtsB